MVRYPHTLTLTWQLAGAFSEGDYTPGSEVTETVEGRAEQNGKALFIRTEDGATIIYEYAFYADRQNFQAPYGATATLDTGWSGTVKGQANHQTGTQIWL